MQATFPRSVVLFVKDQSTRTTQVHACTRYTLSVKLPFIKDVNCLSFLLCQTSNVFEGQRASFESMSRGVKSMVEVDLEGIHVPFAS